MGQQKKMDNNAFLSKAWKTVACSAEKFSLQENFKVMDNETERHSHASPRLKDFVNRSEKILKTLWLF